jgi:hypothetical protein
MICLRTRTFADRHNHPYKTMLHATGAVAPATRNLSGRFAAMRAAAAEERGFAGGGGGAGGSAVWGAAGAGDGAGDGAGAGTVGDTTRAALQRQPLLQGSVETVVEMVEMTPPSTWKQLPRWRKWWRASRPP